MTLEEEESETNLNTVLKQKINDLKDQINIKTPRYDKLKENRAQFKKKSQQQVSEINTEIKKLKDNTTDKLNELIIKHNEDLKKKKKENDKKLESLRREHERAIENFNQKKTMIQDKKKL